MAFTLLTFPFGSVLTSTKMTQLQDNFTGLANGDAGAPKIQTAAYNAASVDQAAIGAAAVGQGELKTATGIVSTNTKIVHTTMAGGQYGFWPELRTSQALNRSYSAAPADFLDATTSFIDDLWALGTSYGCKITLGSSNTDATIYAQQRYINASPPYDLGDGVLPIFIFAVIDNTTGKIESVYTAEEPPWALNGPTDIAPIAFTTKGEGLILSIDEINVPSNLNEIERKIALLEAPRILVPVTQDIKQKDMLLIPHPFIGNDLIDKTVVLLDTMSDVTLELAELHCLEGITNELLHEGYLTIGNSSLGRCCPPGVLDVSVKWKNSKRFKL